MDNSKLFVKSCDLQSHLQIKLCSLEGDLTNFFCQKYLKSFSFPVNYVYNEDTAILHISVDLVQDGETFFTSVTSSLKKFNKKWCWNEILQLPALYNMLDMDAKVFFIYYDQLVFKIWDTVLDEKILLAETTSNIFDDKGFLQQGVLDLEINAINSQIPKRQMNEFAFLENVKKRYRSRDLPRVEWLDKLTFRQIEILNEREKRQKKALYLVIEYPPLLTDNKDSHANRQIPVFYYESGPDIAHYPKSFEHIKVVDPQIGKINLSEQKHHMLLRGPNSLSANLHLKPSTVIRDKLLAIISYPPFQLLTSEDQDLVWTYRFYLKDNKKALPKFLQSIKWDNPVESKQALTLINEWQPMDVEDALELLSPLYTIPAIRSYAVNRLQQSSDEDLQSYLLQLVQALRYDLIVGSKRAFKMHITDTYCDQMKYKDLATFLIDRASRNSVLANYFYWYLHVECEEQNIKLQAISKEKTNKPTTANSSRSRNVSESGSPTPYKRSNVTVNDPLISSGQGISHDIPIVSTQDTIIVSSAPNTLEKSTKDISEFQKIEIKDIEEKSVNTDSEDTGKDKSSVPNISSLSAGMPILLQNKDEQIAQMYIDTMKRFYNALIDLGPDGCLRKDVLSAQQSFITRLTQTVTSTTTKDNANRLRKQERLRAALYSGDNLMNPHPLQNSMFNYSVLRVPIPLPLDPEIVVNGIIADETIIFKSALNPCLFTFKTMNQKKPYKVIFKHGDDLRQDQLILQIIKLIDKLWRQDNLDLKLTPYRVLATSTRHGLVQYVESHSIAEILATDGSLQNYFLKQSRYYVVGPTEIDECGINNSIMDAYTKSCAGYCVITYLLGIGDRHFDNLLITKTGKLFHIDFGYILGREPKPLAPLIKFSKEMLEGMGGTHSTHYQNFRKFAYTAFLHIRRHANLITNLFSLMLDANIPDIMLERNKVVEKVYEKFRLDLSEEDAVIYMQNLIDTSANAVMAVLVEQIHKFAQYWRK